MTQDMQTHVVVFFFFFGFFYILREKALTQQGLHNL